MKNLAPMTPQSFACRMFTMIELLMVVSIIILIMAMLMPTLQMVQDLKNASHCENNMHQLSSSWLSYATDNGGKLVSAFTADDKDAYNDPSTPYPGNCWALNSMGANNGSKTVDACEKAIKHGALWNYVGTVKAYQCPIFPQGHDPKAFRNGGWGKLRNYSMNQYANGGSGWGDFYGLPALTLTAVPDPENTYVFCEEDDIRGDLLGSFIVSGRGGTFVDRIGRWHSFGSVFSFADGHAKRWRWLDEKTKKFGTTQCGHFNGDIVGTTSGANCNVDLVRMHKAVSPGNPRNQW